MNIFKIFKNKSIANVVAYDYDGYDIVFESGKTNVNLYDEFNKIVTNEQFDINTL